MQGASCLDPLSKVNIFSDQQGVSEINTLAGKKYIKHLSGQLEGVYYKVLEFVERLWTVIKAQGPFGDLLDRALLSVDGTRIFGDIDYLISGNLLKDLKGKATDVLGAVQKIPYAIVNVISTALFLEAGGLISLGGIASAIGKIPLVGAALVEFGVGSFIQVTLVVGGVIGAVRDVLKYKNGDINGYDLAAHLVAKALDVSARVCLVAAGYYILVPIFGMISKGIGVYIGYKERVEDAPDMETVKNSEEKIELSAWGVVQRVSRTVKRAFDSIDFNNKLAKLGIVVLPKITALAGFVPLLKPLKGTLDFIGMFRAWGELSETIKAAGGKILLLIKAITGVAMATLESLLFLAHHSLLGLGRIAGNIGFKVLGVVGRLSLMAVKNTLVVAFYSIDVYLNIKKLMEGKKTLSKLDVGLRLANSALKVGVIVLAGGALLFAGFAATTPFFVLSVAACVMDLFMTVKEKVIPEEAVTVPKLVKQPTHELDHDFN